MTRSTIYLNLRGLNLVLDISDNGGLWLLSKYKKHAKLHYCICSQTPFSFWKMPDRWRALVGVGQLRWKKGRIYSCCTCDTDSSLSVCFRAEYPLQQTGEVRSNHRSPINQSWVHKWMWYEFIEVALVVLLWQKHHRKNKRIEGQCLYRKKGTLICSLYRTKTNDIFYYNGLSCMLFDSNTNHITAVVSITGRPRFTSHLEKKKWCKKKSHLNYQEG